MHICAFGIRATIVFRDKFLSWKVLCDAKSMGTAALDQYGKVARVEILTAVLLKIQVFWDVTSCLLVSSYWHSEAVQCLHHNSKAVQKDTLLWMLNHETERTTILQNICNYQLTRCNILKCLIYTDEVAFFKLSTTWWRHTSKWRYKPTHS